MRATATRRLPVAPEVCRRPPEVRPHSAAEPKAASIDSTCRFNAGSFTIATNSSPFVRGVETHGSTNVWRIASEAVDQRPPTGECPPSLRRSGPNGDGARRWGRPETRTLAIDEVEGRPTVLGTSTAARYEILGASAPRNWVRSSRFSTFPVALRGSASTMAMSFGTLNFAS